MSEVRQSAMCKIAAWWRRQAIRLRRSDPELAHRVELEADYIETDNYKYKLRGYPSIPGRVVVKADGWVSQPMFRWSESEGN